MSQLEDEHWWFMAKRHIVMSLIKKYAPEIGENSFILDAGCGTGGNIEYFRKLSANIKGMEMCDAARVLAGEKTGAEVLYGRFPDEIPYADGSFDLVLMLDVLEHIDDDTASLKNIRDKIRDDSYLVLTVPAFKFLWSAHDESHQHKRRYLLHELEQKAVRCGYEPVYSSYFNTFLFPLIAIIRLLKCGKSDDLKQTNRILNKILYKIMSFEAVLMNAIKLPFGVSIVMVLKKNL